MRPNPTLLVLAAGKGTRMQSDLPKVLHQIGQAPMLAHVITAGTQLDPSRIIVVTGHEAELVETAADYITPFAQTVRQEPQLGTGHAVLQAKELLSDFAGDVYVLYGDTPFISPETLERMADARSQYDLVVLGFDTADADARYGRLIAQGDALERIVEYKDATPEERAVRLCNSGVLCMDRAQLMGLLDQVGNDNANEEYYLTDIVALARQANLSAGIVRCDESETLGVNSRAELARAEALFQAKARQAALDNGVIMQAPDTVIFAQDTHIGRDAIIEPYVVFGPNVSVESGAQIRAFSHLEGCHVGADAQVGPYGRLRPGAELDQGAKVGNFCEIKNAQLHAGVKVNHLSYIGDAEIGAGTNVGAGTVTCNYDGVMKHRTVIGERAFIGSDTMLVAPVHVGDEAMTASGSVITQDVPDGALAIGRAKQDNKPNFARRLMDKLRAIKAKKGS